MRFSWTPFRRGLSAPLIAVGLRRNGYVLDTAPLLMVDTGADGILLHFRWAKLMGLQDADLVEEQCTGAGGSMTVHRPQSLARTDIEINGKWITIPKPPIWKARTDIAAGAGRHLFELHPEDDGDDV